MSDSHSDFHPDVTKPDGLYETPPPWDIGRPQPAFLALAAAGAVRGRVLDVRCGTGEHALLAARRGLDATGVDLAANALDTARQKARDRGLSARFLRRDALRLAELTKCFDTMLDCGLFHHFDGVERAACVAGLRAVVRPRGRYFMLGFSDRQPGEGGPQRLTRTDISSAFAPGWRIDALEPATIEIANDPHGIRAWLVAVTRQASSTPGDE